ncbi:MAG: Fe(3+) ABC transporter substrate-binding protein [Reyranellaceae bacterium]
MSFTRRHMLAAAALTVLAGALAAAPVLAQGQELNVYSSRHYDIDKQLYEGFKAKTGITVKVISASAEQLVERIKREGAQSPGDVMITVDIGNLWRAQSEGLFQPVKSAELDRIVPAHLRDPDGNWFGLSMRARVFVYDKTKIDPKLIQSYADLASPALKGKVLIRSSTNVYNQSLTAALIYRQGTEKTEAWAKGLVANLARAPKGGDTDQIKAVAAGEGAVSVNNTYYFARLLASDKAEDKETVKNLAIVFPDQKGAGTHVNISGIGVLKNAPNKDNAVKFIEYLVSPEAQKIFAEGNYEYPVRAGVAPHPVIASWGEFKTDQASLAQIGKNTPEALKVMDRAGWK